MFKSILVPLDGSELAEKALPYALRLATALDADLTLLRVIDIPEYPRDPLQPEHVRTANKYLAQVKDWLSSDREFLHFSNRIGYAVLLGDPAEEVSFYAQVKEQSLVVMTTHGRSGFSQLMFGSVAGKLVHKIKSPIMLVRPFGITSNQNFEEVLEAQDEPYANSFLRNGIRLLVPLDQTEKSEAALAPAFDLAKPLNAALHLIKVNLPSENIFYGESISLAFSPEEVARREAQDREAARLYLGQFAQQANAEGIETVVQAITGGNPADEIVRYANQVEPDLIVMATHARGEFGRLIFGSVANRVLQATHLPVLMVPTVKTGAKQPVAVTTASKEQPVT